MKRLTDDQANILYEYLKASIDPKDTLLQVSFETGCRVGELLLLTPRDIQGAYLSITPLKNSNPRQVLISEGLAKKIQRLSAQAPKRLVNLTTETRNKASQRRALCRRFGDITERLFGERLNAHRLRHTAFTRLYAKTKDLLLVKDWAGHKSTSSTLVYLAEDRRAEGDKAMSKILA